jgi:hypothetical protein
MTGLVQEQDRGHGTDHRGQAATDWCRRRTGADQVLPRTDQAVQDVLEDQRMTIMIGFQTQPTPWYSESDVFDLSSETITNQL